MHIFQVDLAAEQRKEGNLRSCVPVRFSPLTENTAERGKHLRCRFPVGSIPAMHFHIVSLFPEFFTSPLATALMGRAENAGLVTFSFHNPRDYSMDRHKHVDDRPYGGGPGMVMLPAPLVSTLRAIPQPGRILAMSPAGRPFTQALAQELAAEDHLTLVCGRYEGFDARVGDILPLEYVSVGEAVLNGGECAALAVMEAVARLLPGFMGKEDSGREESFSAGVLEYPHYTRPDVFEGIPVPEILRSGDHRHIAEWRRQQSLAVTLAQRPEMLATAPLNADDAAALAALPRRRPGKHLSMALVHYPVLLEEKKSGASSLTNLDIHDIARTSCTYGMARFFVVTPLRDQQQLLEDILRHWRQGAGARSNPDRAEALSLVSPASSIEEVVGQLEAEQGQRPLIIGSSARWPEGKKLPPVVTPDKVGQLLHHQPVLLLLGTGHGLAPQALALCDGLLRPLRFLNGYNHLSVRAAAAILADRILGDLG